jgi:hypothetical protein
MPERQPGHLLGAGVNRSPSVKRTERHGVAHTVRRPILPALAAALRCAILGRVCTPPPAPITFWLWCLSGRPKSFGFLLAYDSRMTLAIYNPRLKRRERPCHTRARRGLFLIRLLTRLRYRAPETPPKLFVFCYLQDFLKWRDPDSNRGHHDFQSYAKTLRYAVNSYR